MNKKLNLSKLENAICKEEQKDIAGGHVCAACWSNWEDMGKPGGYGLEQELNNRRDPFLKLLDRMLW